MKFILVYQCIYAKIVHVLTNVGTFTCITFNNYSNFHIHAIFRMYEFQICYSCTCIFVQSSYVDLACRPSTTMELLSILKWSTQANSLQHNIIIQRSTINNKQ